MAENVIISLKTSSFFFLLLLYQISSCLRADKNGDGKLNADELESKIVDNMIHHLDEGQNESKVIFQVIDQDADRMLSLY